MAEPLEAQVAAALARIRNPRLDNDLLSAGMVRDLVVSDDGAVSFTFLLAPEDPATLVRQARTAVQAIEGVRRDAIKIAVTNPAGPAKVTHGPPSGGEAGPRAAARAGNARPRSDHRDLLGKGWSGEVHRLRQPRGCAGRRRPARRADGRGRVRPQHPPHVRGLRAPAGGRRQDPAARGVRRAPHVARLPGGARRAGDLARPHHHEDRAAVPARRGVGTAGLLPRGSPARHRRRAALAGAGDSRVRGADRHHAAGDGGGRRAPRGPDVRAGRRAGARHRGEHERLRGSGERPPVRAVLFRRRASPRRRAGGGSARQRAASASPGGAGRRGSADPRGRARRAPRRRSFKRWPTSFSARPPAAPSPCRFSEADPRWASSLSSPISGPATPTSPK